MLLLMLTATIAQQCTRNAYAILATNDNAWCGAHVLALSLIDTNTSNDIVIMHYGDVHRRQYAGVKYEKVTPAKALGNGQWKDTYSKFWAGRLVRYCYVMLLDADNIVLRNMDHLFALGEYSYAAPLAYWLSRGFLQTGVVVMKPSTTLFSDVLENSHGKYLEDMDYFNRRHGSRTKHLHPRYNTLIGQWYPRDRIYNYVTKDVYSVHFVAEWKPYKFTSWSLLDAPGREIYNRWWTYARQVECASRIRALDPGPTTKGAIKGATSVRANSAPRGR